MAKWTRRGIIASTLAVSGALHAERSAIVSVRRRPSHNAAGAARIDVHQHFLPPEFLAALERHGKSAWAPAPWSEPGALDLMDDNHIQLGILSLSTPGPHLGNDAEARVLARQVNESLAALVHKRPDRFGMFASLPLPDIDGSLEAIRHGYDTLSADGVILLANNQGIYLGDPMFEPVMEELNRRSAIALVHPGPLPGPPAKGIHPSLADFLLDTTRAAINLASHGITRRYPAIRFILSHGGGFLPYAADRITSLSHIIADEVDTNQMQDAFKSFYFDTALSGSPTALPALTAFARPGHILFGSDWPYCPSPTVGKFTLALDAYDSFDDARHTAINYRNAQALFPRLVA
jgi:6-methylsalicylate decarboxylase